MMLKIFFIAFVFPIVCLSQRVDKKGNIYNETDSIIIGSIKVDEAGLLSNSFTLFDKADNEIAVVNPQGIGSDFHYEIFFSKTNHKGICASDLMMKSMIARAFVKSKICVDGKYRSEKEAQFISYLPNSQYLGDNVTAENNSINLNSISGALNQLFDNIGTKVSTSAKPTELETVQRNRNSEIFIIGIEIQQDFKKIGEVTTTQKAESGAIVKTIKVFNSVGSQVAEAECEAITGKNYNIITLKDNRKQSITIQNKFEDLKEIVKMLVKNYYL